MRSIAFALRLAGGLLAALFAVSGPAPMPAAGKTGQQPAREATMLESAIASKLHQLASLKGDIDEGGCEFVADDASIEACQQLEAQARSLEAEIDELKARAGPILRTGQDEASRPVSPSVSPRPRPYSYRWRTDPAVSYRTLCVRLCDGFYFPINDRSQPGNFLAEERACQSRCVVPARLFYQPAPAGDASEMVALTGERYADLPNAFRYRAEYVESCACGLRPWTDEAKTIYERRAVLATRTSAERIVAAGAGEMAKILADAEPVVAERPTRPRDAMSRAKLDRGGLGLFARIRAMRQRAALRAHEAQASSERRLFLFRAR